MPLARYFLFVGGVLLALLFVSNAVIPAEPATEPTSAGTDKSTIRIHSVQKWPERIVFDTSIPAIVPAQTAKTETARTQAENTEAGVAAPTTVAEYSAKARVRETFAQFRPSDEVKPEPKAQAKRKIAKNPVPPARLATPQPPQFAPPMRLVARQPQFGFFGSSIW